MPIKSWHGNCRYRYELIIFGGFLGLNMIVSIARESRADSFCVTGWPQCGLRRLIILCTFASDITIH